MASRPGVRFLHPTEEELREALARSFAKPFKIREPLRKCEVCGDDKGVDCAHSSVNDYGHYCIKICHICGKWGDHWGVDCPKPNKIVRSETSRYAEYLAKHGLKRFDDVRKNPHIRQSLEYDSDCGDDYLSDDQSLEEVKDVAKPLKEAKGATSASKRQASEVLEGAAAKRLSLYPDSEDDYE